MMKGVSLWSLSTLLLAATTLAFTDDDNQFLQPLQEGSAEGKAAESMPTIVVAKSGGKFATIQAAINSVPANNKNWVKIHVKAGIYKEQVNIPLNKPFIFLEGEGMTKTQITWNGFSDIKKPTFRSSAENFVASNIGFVNTHNYPADSNENPIVPAVAAMIEGDKSAFYQCGFYGMQDTLWDVTGRHYYYGCTFVGAIDFIFGRALSLYEQCTITVAPLAFSGYITAQGKMKATDKSGFAFKNCNINGGKAFLGRAWGAFSTVIFYQTKFSNQIEPAGWKAWKFPGAEKQFTYVEAASQGQGLNSAARVGFAKKVSPPQAAQFASLKFIEADTWLGALPKPSASA